MYVQFRVCICSWIVVSRTPCCVTHQESRYASVLLLQCILTRERETHTHTCVSTAAMHSDWRLRHMQAAVVYEALCDERERHTQAAVSRTRSSALKL
jgi:hypothetical protein